MIGYTSVLFIILMFHSVVIQCDVFFPNLKSVFSMSIIEDMLQDVGTP